MGPLYDIEPLILSIRDVVKAYPDAHLELIGDGPDRTRLEALAQESAIQDHVTFCGTLPPDETRLRMSRSSINFVPIANTPEHQYSMPVKLIESLSLGVPAIGWGTEGTYKLIEDSGGGVFLDEPCPGVISRLIIEMLGDTDRLLEYSKNARAYAAEHLDRDKTQVRINRIYDYIRGSSH